MKHHVPILSPVAPFALFGMLMLSAAAMAVKPVPPYVIAGNCAKMPADRVTEFHGNPAEADLLMGMAGNQWVVFAEVLQAYNLHRGLDNSKPVHQANYTLAELREPNRKYYVQLIPPGQIRDQIKSGCLLLGNDEEAEPTRNFHPTSVQVAFDVYTSTNYGLMRDLAKSGFLTQAIPYTKSNLDMMVDATNSKSIGTGVTEYDKVVDLVMDLLSSGIVVSQVDHINEGIHAAINSLYKQLDEYIRDAGTAGDNTALDSALDAIKVPQAGSPAQRRTTPGDPLYDPKAVAGNFVLANNAECTYPASSPHAGKLRLCEFAVLNKANTHETRVHHVETPNGILGTAGYAAVDVGPVWVSELQYAVNKGSAISGVGIPTPAGADPKINTPETFSIALLATAMNKVAAQDFIDWIRGADAQAVYVSGGFTPMTGADLAGGEIYDANCDGAVDKDGNGNVIVTPRAGFVCP